MDLFNKHKIIYVTSEKSEKRLVVTKIENGKPICKSKKVNEIDKEGIYRRGFFGVLTELNGSPIVEKIHAYERVLLLVKELLILGVPEDKIIGFSCSYTKADNLIPKMVSNDEFKTMKKQYKCKRD